MRPILFLGFLQSIGRDGNLDLLDALAVEEQFDAPEQHARSKNLSQRGVFFTTDLPLSKGSSLDLLVEMPEQVTGVPPTQWLCTGHVVRVVPTEQESKRGVGVQFDFYEVSRPERPRWAMGAGLRGPLAVPVGR